MFAEITGARVESELPAQGVEEEGFSSQSASLRTADWLSPSMKSHATFTHSTQ